MKVLAEPAELREKDLCPHCGQKGVRSVMEGGKCVVCCYQEPEVAALNRRKCEISFTATEQASVVAKAIDGMVEALHAMGDRRVKVEVVVREV